MQKRTEVLAAIQPISKSACQITVGFFAIVVVFSNFITFESVNAA